MKKIIIFLKRLYRFITGKKIRPYIEKDEPIKSNKMLGAPNYDFDIDYTDVYDTIKNCKTIKGLQKECKKYNITINTDINKFAEDKTIQCKTKYLYELTKVYLRGVAEQYKNTVNAKLAEIISLRDRRLKEIRLQGLKYDIEINYEQVYNIIANCKTTAGLQKECKERGVYITTDVVHISPYKTIQLICEELKGLLQVYSESIIERYNQVYESKLKDIELLRNKRIEDLKTQGLLCPHCHGMQKKYYRGLVRIWFFDNAGGPLNGGTEVGTTASNEYQFHYKKCKECGEWKMYEYRLTPGWLHDLFGTGGTFYEGDIIEKYMQRKEYSSHKIKRM